MKFKVGDKVVFTHYENEDEWEKVYGVDVMDVVEVAEVDDYNADKTYRVITKTKDSLFVYENQLKHCTEDNSNEDQDVVNNPNHYTSGGIECIDAMQASIPPEQFKGFLRGNVQKYCWRCDKKNGLEDLKKARWYLDKLIETIEKEQGSCTE